MKQSFRSRRYRWRTALLLLLLSPIVTSAETPAEPTTEALKDALGCTAAIERVLREHPLLRRDNRKAREISESPSLWNYLSQPELRLRSDAGTRNHQTRVGMRLPLEVPGAIRAEQESLRGRIALNEAEFETVIIRTTAALRRSYAKLRHAYQERLRLAALLENARQILESTKAESKIGLVSILSESSAAIRVTEAQEELAAAQSREVLAEKMIRRWTKHAAEKTEIDCIELSSEDSIQQVGNHAAVRMAAGRAHSATSDVLAESRQGWLWPSFLEITWVGEREGDDGLLLQAGLELPLPRNGQSKAMHRERQMSYRLDRVREKVAADIDSAKARLQEAESAGQRSISAQGQIREAEKLLRRGHEVGADTGELWDLARSISSWQQRANQVQLDAALSSIDYRLALGLR